MPAMDQCLGRIRLSKLHTFTAQVGKQGPVVGQEITQRRVDRVGQPLQLLPFLWREQRQGILHHTAVGNESIESLSIEVGVAAKDCLDRLFRLLAVHRAHFARTAYKANGPGDVIRGKFRGRRRRSGRLRWLGVRRSNVRTRSGGGRHTHCRRALQIVEHVPERRKIIQSEVFTRRNVEILAQLAEELGLLDAVDAQVGFQIGV